MALADAGADFLTELQDDPVQAARRAQELASAGEFTVDQILGPAWPSCPDCSRFTRHGAGPARAQRRQNA
ncbi:hypothetical protein ACFU6I_39050 [Streptomyces sp. NPDC057486]|uniref:hypothetical protein n=1 Tax=Streptomyces sp. NPDC057486 TaxID=3346145 RepID=UPI0036764025